MFRPSRPKGEAGLKARAGELVVLLLMQSDTLLNVVLRHLEDERGARARTRGGGCGGHRGGQFPQSGKGNGLREDGVLLRPALQGGHIPNCFKVS